MLPLLCFAAALASALVVSQDRSDAPAPSERPDAPAVPDVYVPRTPNPVCPIMGKPISNGLFVDTLYGRMYLCCKPCAAQIRTDVELAYRSGFPHEVDAENRVCPVSGRPIPAIEPDGQPAAEPARVSLQGLSIALCCSECIPTARELAQVVLVKVQDPSLVHVDNRTCPLTAEPAGRNTILVVKGHIVHVSSTKLVERVRAEPDVVLREARAIAEREAQERRRREAERAESEAQPENADGAGGDEGSGAKSGTGSAGA